MTELTDNPQRHPRDVVEPDSGTEDIRPNLKRHWNRRWRRYLFALIPAIFLTLMAIFVMTLPRGCTLGAIEPCCVDVEFDLRQVLATVPGDVEIWTCIDWKCVRRVGPSSMWATFEVHDDEELDDPHAEVRVIVRSHGRVVFDATRLLELRAMWANDPLPLVAAKTTNEPGCGPLLSDGRVLATPEGDLIQLIPPDSGPT